ncbi:MAG: Asp-tRNA(Asn)/Glu-tRNA(Gln) amidotransferase subunit GatB [Candidatus Sericytochromatia bacterium]|nr:Asp-tRNA(Asn)/Glu-tRNA(Gln) amidotransferase subunit GatB [Candidatus Tanganyikabacteria bacterium]
MASFEAVIGLEVHAELATRTKIFCGCSASFGAEPNTHVCPVCAGLPGVLPVLNQTVVDYAIMAGLALNCRVQPTCKFDRKNYFYPDLPKAYQISQFDQPICRDGWLEVPGGDGATTVRIHRIHMEEDAGKLVHVGAAGLEGATHSLVDLNRAGVPLLEIVSEPDIRSSEEAKAYLQELRLVLMVLGINDGRLEEGSLRCDANVSIRPAGATELGTRTEIKNLNSFRFLQRAIDYEVARQTRLVSEGGTVVQETRLWSEERGVTYSMRSKEEAHDYRYFPEPDLVRLAIGQAWVDEVLLRMPELPARRRSRYRALGLSAVDAAIIAADRALSTLFDRAAEGYRNPRAIANWLIGDVTALANQERRNLEDLPLQPHHLQALVEMVEKGAITSQGAKKALPALVLEGKDPVTLVAEMGLAAIGDEGMLRDIVDRVVSTNPAQVAEYRAGKTKVLGFLMGQVMRETRGRGVPEVVQRLLAEALAER